MQLSVILGIILEKGNQKMFDVKKILIISIGAVFLILCSCELADAGKSGTPAERIEGTWAVDENSSLYKSALSPYNVYISADPADSNQVYISNFYQIGNSNAIRANIDENSISIPKQEVDGFQIIGSGSISSKFETINLIYDVDDGSGEIDEVSAVYTKIY